MMPMMNTRLIFLWIGVLLAIVTWGTVGVKANRHVNVTFATDLDVHQLLTFVDYQTTVDGIFASGSSSYKTLRFRLSDSGPECTRVRSDATPSTLWGYYSWNPVTPPLTVFLSGSYHVCVESGGLLFTTNASITVRSRAPTCSVPSAMIFIMDSSGSVRFTEYQQMRNLVSQMIERNGGQGTTYAVIQFAPQPLELLPTSNATAAIEAVQQHRQYRAGTAFVRYLRVAEGLIYSGSNGTANFTRNVIVLLTDGVSSDIPQAIEVGRELKNRGVYLMVIGFGAASLSLRELASVPQSVFFSRVADLNMVTTIDPLTQASCGATGGSDCQAANGGSVDPTLPIRLIVSRRWGAALGGELLEVRIPPACVASVTQSPTHSPFCDFNGSLVKATPSQHQNDTWYCNTPLLQVGRYALTLRLSNGTASTNTANNSVTFATLSYYALDDARVGDGVEAAVHNATHHRVTWTSAPFETAVQNISGGMLCFYASCLSMRSDGSPQEDGAITLSCQDAAATSVVSGRGVATIATTALRLLTCAASASPALSVAYARVTRAMSVLVSRLSDAIVRKVVLTDALVRACLSFSESDPSVLAEASRSCADWINREDPCRNVDFEAVLPACPADLVQADFAVQRAWTIDPACNRSKNSSCTYHPGAFHCIRLTVGRYGQQCCYARTGGALLQAPSLGAGTPDCFAPGGLGVIGHYIHDVAPYCWCCRADVMARILHTEDCNNYLKRRPPAGPAPLQREGRTRGDPQCVTLDGRSFLCNFWGEAVMLRIPGVIELQGRAAPPSSFTTMATVLTALVVASPNTSTVQFEFDALSSQNSSVLQVFLDGVLQQDFVITPEIPGRNVVVTRVMGQGLGGEGFDVYFTMSGIMLRVRVNSGLLRYTASVPEAYRGAVWGLSGHYNGNMSDDFRLRDGTVLPSDVTAAVIHTQFVTHWMTSSLESNFTYPVGLSHGTYQNRNYEPAFTIRGSVTSEQQAACGEDFGCLYDASLLGVQHVSSVRTDTAEVHELVSLRNFPPRFLSVEVDSRWNASGPLANTSSLYRISVTNQDVSFQVTLMDPDGDEVVNVTAVVQGQSRPDEPMGRNVSFTLERVRGHDDVPDTWRLTLYRDATLPTMLMMAQLTATDNRSGSSALTLSMHQEQEVPDADASGGLSVGTIAGITIGVIAVIGAVFLGSILLFRRKALRSRRPTVAPVIAPSLLL